MNSALNAARARRLAARPANLGSASLLTGNEGLGLAPNRPEPWAAYALPVETDQPVLAASSADAGWSEASWGAAPAGGVLMETTEDASVELVQLENQREPAEVVLVGPLHGVTVVTRHAVEGPAGPKAYLLVHGLLSRPGPAVVSGARLEPGSVVGFVGDDEGTRLPQLYFEVRQLRGGPTEVVRRLSALVSPASSIPCDPRNVLQLR